uniref:Uncharacterized protein n=1 Tax=Pelusios castaneus TaxID=367368 RepID=A0A8C8SHD2_9SAUR
ALLPGRRCERDAGQHPSRRQVEPGLLLQLLYCVFLVGTKEIGALTDFSGKAAGPCAALGRHNPPGAGRDGLSHRWAGQSCSAPGCWPVCLASRVHGQDLEKCLGWAPQKCLRSTGSSAGCMPSSQPDMCTGLGQGKCPAKAPF